MAQISGIFSSLIVRMLMLLLLVFALSLAVVYWIINAKGKPEVTKLASQTIVEIGNESVNGLLSGLKQTDGIANSTSLLIGSLPKDAQIINQSFGNLITHTNNQIISGGVWFEPNAYQADVEQRAFVWRRDGKGVMQADNLYSAINPASDNLASNATTTTPSTASAPSKPVLPSPYYRDWWYVPAMYANHDACVWSRAYIQADSKQPVITCAKAIYSPTKGFEGVVSFDVILSRLQGMAQEWQKKTGGYVFLVDMNNNFLTYPEANLIRKVTDDNPQGELLSVDNFAQQYPNFLPIAQHLDRINNNLINHTRDKDSIRFDFVANTIVSSTNLRRTTLQEANILTALLFANPNNQTTSTMSNHYVEQVALADDRILKQPSTAFIFNLANTNWKLVIVKPNRELTAFANRLNGQLQWYLLLAFIPMLLLSGYVFRRLVGLPLKRMRYNVQQLGNLIAQKRYLALNDYKLPDTAVSEVAAISTSMNQLIDRVVENEGTLAKVNEQLEQQVVERTEHLNQALKDLKASQVQLVQAEKMSTLGQMVAGVAHEVNTPLGYVKSNLDLIDENFVQYQALVESTQQLKTLMQDTQPDVNRQQQALEQSLRLSDEIVEYDLYDDLKGLINDAQFGIAQIAELVVNLRDFSRLDQAKVKAVNVNELIKSSLTMARNNLKQLHITTELDSTSEIRCNPSQINQVLLNLFNNAAQAMPAEKIAQGQASLDVKSFEDANNVYIRVSDTGSGMTQAVLENIFEPFFTTKPAGEGTGLGLAISAQIMEQHGGDIDVVSWVGEGTQFTLRLPKTVSTPQATSPNTSPKKLFIDA